MTTDTSFIDNPPSSRVPTKFATPSSMTRQNSGPNRRGGLELPSRGARGGVNRGSNARGIKGSGIARGKPRGLI